MAEVTSLLACCHCGNKHQAATLLDCLHGYCNGCLTYSGCDGDRQTIACPKCGVVTTTSSKTRNSCAAAKCNASNLSSDSLSCEVCCSKGRCDGDRRAAERWCTKCCKALCDECSEDHARHVSSHAIVSLHETFSAPSASCHSPSRLCAIHNRNINYRCLQCERFLCSAAAAPCLANRHDVQRMGDERMDDLAQEAAKDLRGLLESLERSASSFSVAAKLPEIQGARKRHLDVLLRNKRIVLDEVEKVYNEAVISLNDIYDLLVARALRAVEEAELLNNKVQHAIAYCKEFVEAADTINLLQQERCLSAQLQALSDRIREVPVIDPEHCVELTFTCPSGLYETCKLWIGVPRLLVNLEPQLLDYADDVELNQLTMANRFQTREDFADMAIMADGHVLVAAATRGLKEYGYSSEVLSGWTPAYTRAVHLVRELQPGRLIIGVEGENYKLSKGLSNGVQLLLLMRNPLAADAWLEDRQIAELEGTCQHLSVHGELMAFVQTQRGDEQAEQHIVLLGLSRSQDLLRVKPDYPSGYEGAITSLALTAHAIVAAIAGTPKLDSHKSLDHLLKSYSHDGNLLWAETSKLVPRKGLEYLLKSYSHGGNLLWAQKSNEKVSDICAAPSGRVLYLELESSQRVVAIVAATGLQLAETLEHQCFPESSLWLSLSRGAKPFLAVGSKRDRQITVYSTAALHSKK